MRLAISLIILILIFFIVQQFFGVLVPKYNDLLKSSQDKNEAVNKLHKVELIKNKINEILNKDVIPKIYSAEKEGWLDLYLPKKYEDYELTLMINALFRSSNLGEPNVYKFSDEKLEIPNIPSLVINKKVFEVSFKSNLNDLLTLLSNIENYSRFFEVESLDIKKEENNLLGVKIKLAYFYLGGIKPYTFENEPK